MTDQTVLVHINTPPAVTDAITTLATACHEWTPTAMSLPSDHPPIALPPPSDADADAICHFVTSPAPLHGMLPQFEAVGTLVFAIMLVLFMTRVYLIPGALCRLAWRGARRLYEVVSA